MSPAQWPTGAGTSRGPLFYIINLRWINSHTSFEAPRGLDLQVPTATSLVGTPGRSFPPSPSPLPDSASVPRHHSPRKPPACPPLRRLCLPRRSWARILVSSERGRTRGQCQSGHKFSVPSFQLTTSGRVFHYKYPSSNFSSFFLPVRPQASEVPV